MSIEVKGNAGMKFAPIVASGLRHIPKVTSRLGVRDILGRWAARWGIGRMHFRVDPGLYAVGNAGKSSPVFVTANYRMTFDLVRAALDGLDAFILVLDTKGINVWCAAGKGTFGTDELVHRITSSGLAGAVDGRELVLPQLGAVGVAAHEVRARTGFSVKYGPVDVADLKAYLAAGKTKTRAMARVKFGLRERLAIVPVEIAHAWPIILGIAVAGALLSLPLDSAFGSRLYVRFFALAGFAAAGIVLFPPFLPYVPFRAFAAKGAFLGCFWALAAAFVFGMGWETAVPIALAGIPLTSFLAMQYTGASTYTNLTGASLEVKRGIPVIAVSQAVGIVWLALQRIL